MNHISGGVSNKPICEAADSFDIAEATRAIYGHVDCEDCLRRAIADREAGLGVLRELLAKVEAAS